jgi:hypothetical protein
MKHSYSHPSTRLFLITLLSIFTALGISSCARKISFQNSTVVPAAEGSVKLKKDFNNNYEIKIFLGNLAEPQRLEPQKTNYVVWMESDDNYIKNIGQINTSTGFMSNKLKATFETVSAVKPTRIYITAEDDPATQYPGTQVVLSTNRF